MRESDDIQARLQAAAVATDAVAETLAAGLDGFAVLLASCRASEDRSPVEWFAAFAFAALAAAEGRRILLTAPSLPPSSELAASHAASVAADPGVTADALAGLAGALSARLSSAARHAQNPGDHAACTGAASEAARVRELLAGGD